MYFNNWCIEITQGDAVVVAVSVSAFDSAINLMPICLPRLS